MNVDPQRKVVPTLTAPAGVVARSCRLRPRVAARAFAVSAICLALAGCTAKYTPLSLRASRGSTQIQWRACASKHTIWDLELYSGPLAADMNHKTALWQVTSVGGATTAQATLGVTPPGFRVVTPLTTALLPNQQYTLMANLITTHSVVGRVTFLPVQLKDGVVIYEEDQLKTVAAYNHMSNQDFGC